MALVSPASGGTLADLRVRVHFRLAISGRNLGSIQVCRTAERQRSIRPHWRLRRQVRSGVGGVVGLYITGGAGLWRHTCLQVHIRSCCRSTTKKLCMYRWSANLWVSTTSSQGHLPKVGAGGTWYNELRVFSWRAQCASASGGKQLRNLTVTATYNVGAEHGQAMITPSPDTRHCLSVGDISTFVNDFP